MFAYAANNPVKYTDPDGRIAFCAVTALVGAGIGAGIAAYKSYKETGKIDGWQVLEGAVVGGVIGLGLGLVGAELATTTTLQAGNCLANFGEVTGIGISSAATATTEASIWTLDKFARGWEAEKRLGGMMSNFPTIDKFDKIKNTISSIKSIDLTCKTYQTASAITRTLNGYAAKLANFTSGKLGQLNFTANNATQRCLEVAIPKGATSEQLQAIQNSVEYAKSIGVQLIIYEIE